MKKSSLYQTNQDLWDDYKKWRVCTQRERQELHSKSIYENHPLFSPLMIIGNCAIAVIDLKTMSFLYNSPNYEEFTGFKKDDYEKGGVQFVFSKIEPDDQVGMTAFSELINKYFKNLLADERKHYQAYFDYRIKSSNGDYYKVIQQDCALKYTTDGQIEELLVIAFKISNVTSSNCLHLRLTNGKENLFYKYDHKLKSIEQLQLLSRREMEIAKLIAQSYSLKKIADYLDISFNTVRVHHANALHKMNVNDSVELVNLLRTWAFI